MLAAHTQFFPLLAWCLQAKKNLFHFGCWEWICPAVRFELQVCCPLKLFDLLSGLVGYTLGCLYHPIVGCRDAPCVAWIVGGLAFIPSLFLFYVVHRMLCNKATEEVVTDKETHGAVRLYILEASFLYSLELICKNHFLDTYLWTTDIHRNLYQLCLQISSLILPTYHQVFILWTLYIFHQFK